MVSKTTVVRLLSRIPTKYELDDSGLSHLPGPDHRHLFDVVNVHMRLQMGEGLEL